jgi:hypothetical protein
MQEGLETTREPAALAALAAVLCFLGVPGSQWVWTLEG